MKYSVIDFVNETKDEEREQRTAFEVVKESLQVNFGTQGGSGGILSCVWIKVGSMVAYHGGNVSLEREGILEHGFCNMLKRNLTGDGVKLTRATGQGHAQLYVAHRDKRVTTLCLQSESLVVNGNNLLAFEPTLTHKITIMKRIAGMVSGDLFNVKLTGTGVVAILSHGRAITLVVAPGHPVYTDPQATVAWSGELTPDYKMDYQVKSFLGLGSGNTFQMKFEANKGVSGFVVIQPYEEFYEPHNHGSA